MIPKDGGGFIQLPADPADFDRVWASLERMASNAQKNITTPCRKCGRPAETFPKIGGPSCRKCAGKGK